MAKISILELSESVGKQRDLSSKDVERFITAMFNLVDDGLDKERQVKIKGLGTFKVTSVKPRESVNVNTGERVVIQGHDKVSFTPDATMRDLVNKPFAPFETVVLNDDVEFPDIEGSTEEQEESVEVPVAPADIPVDQQRLLEVPVGEEENTKPVDVKAGHEERVEAAQEVKKDAYKTFEDTQEKMSDVSEKPVETSEKVSETSDKSEELSDKSKDINVRVDNAHVVADNAHVVVGNAHVVVDNAHVVVDDPHATIQNTTPTDERADEFEELYYDSERRHKRTKVIALVVSVLCLVAGVVLGVLYGDRIIPRTTTPEEAVKVSKPVSQPIETKSPAPAKQTDSIVKKGDIPTKPIVQSDDALDFAKMNADPRVVAGAYNIIGVDTIVTLRAGQTMQSYCNSTLGAGMLCYFQVLNDTTNLGEGAKLKVPKVQIRKRK